MASLLTITDKLEPWLRRINMRHRKKTKKLTLFDQIILRFKLEALYSVKYLKFTCLENFVWKVIKLTTSNNQRLRSAGDNDRR